MVKKHNAASKKGVESSEDNGPAVTAEEVWWALRDFFKAMRDHRLDCANPYRVPVNGDYVVEVTIEVD